MTYRPTGLSVRDMIVRLVYLAEHKVLMGFPARQALFEAITRTERLEQPERDGALATIWYVAHSLGHRDLEGPIKLLAAHFDPC